MSQTQPYQKYTFIPDMNPTLHQQCHSSPPAPSSPTTSAFSVRKPMYHHANIDINSQSPDHASVSTKSSETRQRQIPLAFTNTWWGREYIANPNWEQENLGKSNALVRQGSRGQSEPDGKSLPASALPRSASTTESTSSHSSSTSASAPPTTSPPPPQSSQQYSVMTAWSFFRRTFPHSSPTSDSPATEKSTPDHAEQEEEDELGPWLEMLMRWDDFEQWQLKMLQRSWCLPGTP
jgi:hypothetical protein